MNTNKDQLEVGDKVEVCNPLRSEADSFFDVTKIEGQIAYTAFRKFNKKIYCGKYVYEYGKKLNPVYNNTYIAHKGA